MRVASRRLRSALRDFLPYLRKRGLSSVQKRLRNIADALGEVRDHDVAIMALEELEKEQTGYGQSFRKAIFDLLEGLVNPAATPTQIEMNIQEPDWRPRPRVEDLPGLLRDRMLIGNATIRFFGWMTREEALNLIRRQAERPTNLAAIERLFNDSMSRGTEGAHLEITARRGSAGVKSALAVATLRRNDD